MSAVPRPVPPERLAADDAVRRYVEALQREIEPDPLFRRRLRGTVVNRFVADREGVGLPAERRGSRMGRLGRACLYASLATALSVGGVMAASDTALPGDLIYPLKLSIEEMRMEVAPAHLQDELATAALAERIDELGRLVQSGATTRAADLAVSIRASYEKLAASGNGALAEDRLAAHLARLDAVLDRAPVQARLAIERAMSGAPGLQPHPDGPGRSGGGNGPATPGQGGGSQQGGGGGQPGGGGGQPGGGGGQPDGGGGQSGGGAAPGAAGGNEAPDQVERTPPKDVTPKPDRTPRPERSPKPAPTASPDAP